MTLRKKRTAYYLSKHAVEHFQDADMSRHIAESEQWRTRTLDWTAGLTNVRNYRPLFVGYVYRARRGAEAHSHLHRRMTSQYLTTVLEEVGRVAKHHDQVAQSSDNPYHEYLRYAVLQLLEGEADEVSMYVP